MSIERIGLVTHGGKEAAVSTAEDVRRWAVDHDVTWADIDVWGGAPAARRGGGGRARRAPGPRSSRSAATARSCAGPGWRSLRLRRARRRRRPGRVPHRGRRRPGRGGAGGGAPRRVARSSSGLGLTMRASRPLELPHGMEGLLQYGRGPALPPPRLRPGLPEDVGWGVPLEITAVNDVVFEKLARDRQASSGCTSRTSSSPRTAPTP